METNSHHTRFKSAPWYAEGQMPPVMVGGAGGIGSWVSFLLTRAGFPVAVYDFDLLEEHNLGGQLYPISAIGEKKVDALEKLCKQFHNAEITGYDETIDSDSVTNVIVIAAFDNIKARKDMFMTWLATYTGKKASAIFIDGRLMAEHMEIFCIKITDDESIADYMANYLFDDAEVEDLPCTLKQTSHTAAMIAGHIVGFLTNHVTNIMAGSEERTVPYQWTYFTPLDVVNS